MFSKPKNGWVNIKIEDYKINGSYLTDIPMNFLDSVISSIKTNLPIYIFIDEEGSENIICAYYDEIYIILKHDDVEYKRIDMSFNLFRKNIINGIEMYLNEWINWNMDDDVEELKNRENEFKEKLSIAKDYINKNT